jgi:alkylglycerol monooxygenase
LTTALRQPVLQDFSVWAIYLPLALMIPPGVFAIHSHMNLLYQFWIHNRLVESLGPLG